MFKFIKNIFSSKNVDDSEVFTIDDHLREIISNRYPPYDEGFVVSSGKDLLKQHEYLVSRIKYICGFNDADFKKYYIPVMESYAEFVQLLPASQRNHHKGAGGLLRHGLEVGHYSLESSFFKLFSGRDKTELKRVKEPRWRYATFVAGLLHDVGKPVSDIEIIDKDGKNKWNPYESTISDWAKENGVKRYYVIWNKKRVHKEHEVFSGMVSNMLIPKECIKYISDGGIDISSAMFRSIGGVTNPNNESLLSEIVKKSDSLSTEIDLKNNGDVAVVSGTPVERHIIDAIRELIEDNKYWKPNSNGSRLWKTEEGLFIIWSSAVDDIKSALGENNVPGIPRNKDTLAEILADHGYAEKFINDDGSEKMYWTGSRKIKGITKNFSLLKLAKVASLIEDFENIENSDMVIDGFENNDKGSGDDVNEDLDKDSNNNKVVVDEVDPSLVDKLDKKHEANDSNEEDLSDDDFENEMMKEFNQAMEEEAENYSYSSDMEKDAHTWLLSNGGAGILLDSVLSSVKEEDNYKVGQKGVILNDNLISFHIKSSIFEFSGTNFTEFQKSLSKQGFLESKGEIIKIDNEEYVSLNADVSDRAAKYIGLVKASSIKLSNPSPSSLSILIILKGMLESNNLSLMDITLHDGEIYHFGDKNNFVTKIINTNSTYSRKDVRSLITNNFEEGVKFTNPIGLKESTGGKYCGQSDLREIKKILKNKLERANG